MRLVSGRDHQRSSDSPQTSAVAQDSMWPVDVKQEMVKEEEECKIEVEDHKYECGLHEQKAETSENCKYTKLSRKSNSPSENCCTNATSSPTKVETNIKQECRSSAVICDLQGDFVNNDVADDASKQPSTLIMKSMTNEHNQRGSEPLIHSTSAMWLNEEKQQDFNNETITEDVSRTVLISPMKPLIHEDCKRISHSPQTFAEGQTSTWPIKVKQEVEEEEEGTKIEVEDHTLCKHERGLDKRKAETGQSCKHTKKHNPTSDEKVFMCCKCSFSSTLRRSFVQHIKKVHTDAIYKCSECEYVTKYRQELTCHFVMKHDVSIEPYKCTKCGYETKLKKYINFHMKKKHNVENTSDDCRKRERKIRHSYGEQHNAEPKIYRCSACQFTTKERHSLRKHFTLKHDDDAEVFKCTQCDYATKEKYSLRVHCKVKHDTDARVFACSQCSFTTKMRSALTRHFNFKHDSDAEMFKCTECDYASKRKTSLALHVEGTHGNDAEVYKCTICDYTTKIRRYFLQHKEQRHGEARFKCAECNFTAQWRAHLQNHFRMKHDENAEVFKCTECDFTSKSKYILGEHFKYRHDDSVEVLKCAMCAYTTKRKYRLVYHTKAVHGTDAKR